MEHAPSGYHQHNRQPMADIPKFYHAGYCPRKASRRPGDAKRES